MAGGEARGLFAVILSITLLGAAALAEEPTRCLVRPSVTVEVMDDARHVEDIIARLRNKQETSPAMSETALPPAPAPASAAAHGGSATQPSVAPVDSHHGHHVVHVETASEKVRTRVDRHADRESRGERRGNRSRGK